MNREEMLSAALEDAEGQALVESIIARKQGTIKVMTHEGWQEIGTAAELTLTDEAKLFKEPGWLVPKKMSASVQMQWQDVSHEFMALMLGYGSVEEMREAGRKREELKAQALAWSEYPVILPVPPVGLVRWSCRKPTDPPTLQVKQIGDYQIIVPPWAKALRW